MNNSQQVTNGPTQGQAHTFETILDINEQRYLDIMLNTKNTLDNMTTGTDAKAELRGVYYAPGEAKQKSGQTQGMDQLPLHIYITASTQKILAIVAKRTIEALEKRSVSSAILPIPDGNNIRDIHSKIMGEGGKNFNAIAKATNGTRFLFINRNKMPAYLQLISGTKEELDTSVAYTKELVENVIKREKTLTNGSATISTITTHNAPPPPPLPQTSSASRVTSPPPSLPIANPPKQNTAPTRVLSPPPVQPAPVQKPAPSTAPMRVTSPTPVVQPTPVAKPSVPTPLLAPKIKKEPGTQLPYKPPVTNVVPVRPTMLPRQAQPTPAQVPSQPQQVTSQQAHTPVINEEQQNRINQLTNALHVAQKSLEEKVKEVQDKTRDCEDKQTLNEHLMFEMATLKRESQESMQQIIQLKQENEKHQKEIQHLKDTHLKSNQEKNAILDELKTIHKNEQDKLQEQLNVEREQKRDLTTRYEKLVSEHEKITKRLREIDEDEQERATKWLRLDENTTHLIRYEIYEYEERIKHKANKSKPR